MVLFFAFTFLYIILFLKYGKASIYYLPIMDILVLISRVNYSAGIYSRWAVLLNFIRIFSVLFVYLWIIFTQPKKETSYIKYIKYGVIIFVLYLYSLTFLFSSDSWASFKITLRFTTAILGIVAGLTYFKTLPQLYKLLKSIFWVLGIFLVNVIIASILKKGIGGFYHSASVIYTGGILLWDTYFVSYALLTYPMLFSFFKRKKITIIFLLVSIILILILTIKRTLITIVFMGFLIEFLLSKRKIKYFQKIIGAVLLASIVLFFFFGDIHKAITARKSDLSENLLQTQRAAEYSVIMLEFQNQHSIRIILFGKELFNSSGYFGHEQNIYHLESGRIIHSDYANILWGAGVVGLLLYAIIFMQIILYLLSLKKHQMNLIAYQLYTILWTITVGLFINGFSDGILNFSARMIPFLLLGSFLGVLNNNLNKKTIVTTINNEVKNV